MAKQPKRTITEKELSKGELRKLTAIRKSLGDKIGDKAFAEWLKNKPSPSKAVDRNAELLVSAIDVLRKNEKTFRIPRGGYLVTTGRAGVSVKPAKK